MVTLTMHRELNIVEKRGPLCDAPSLKEKKIQQNSIVKRIYHSFESCSESNAAMIGLLTLKIVPIILAILLELSYVT